MEADLKKLYPVILYMEGYISVEPIDLVRSCTKIRMFINGFTLNAKNCSVRAEQYDSENQLLVVTNVFINDEEYAEWGSDDKYIEDLVMSKLGLTRS